MNICVHTRPRLLLTASVSRLERRSQGLSMKRHRLMGNSKIEFILSKHPIPQHHTAHQSIWRPHHPALIAPLHMIPQIWLLRLKNSQRPYVGGWLISLSSPFSPKEKKKKKHTKTAQQLKHHCRGNTRKGCSFIPMRNNSGFI